MEHVNRRYGFVFSLCAEFITLGVRSIRPSFFSNGVACPSNELSGGRLVPASLILEHFLQTPVT